MLEKILQAMDNLVKFFHDDRFLKFVGGLCVAASAIIVYLPDHAVATKYVAAFLSLMSGYGIYSSTGRAKNGIPKLNGVPVSAPAPINTPDNINTP